MEEAAPPQNEHEKHHAINQRLGSNRRDPETGETLNLGKEQRGDGRRRGMYYNE
jgi:hypothetical protein